MTQSKPDTIDRGALEEMYECYRHDPNFSILRQGGNRLVPGEGGNPRVFIVGEAPGAQEAEKLRPFIGDSGKLLRALMLSAGLRCQWLGRITGAPVIPLCREGLPPNCWLTNTVKYRPPKNRTPNAREIDASRPYLIEEWVTVGAPNILIAVGAVAYRALLPRAPSSSYGLRIGKPLYTIVNPTLTRRAAKQAHVAVFAMYHPSYLLRGGPNVVKPAAQDWQRLGRFLRERGIL